MRCYIKSISVRRDERSKGYGTAIFQTIENYLADKGVDTIFLTYTDESRGFWEAMGFRPQQKAETDRKILHKDSLMEKERVTRAKVDVPNELFAVDVRVVPIDSDPGEYDHLFAWYRKSDGAAVAKARVTFID